MNDKEMEVRYVELVEENGQYYLHIKYRVKDEYEIKEYDIPKAKIPLNLSRVPFINKTCERDSFGRPIMDSFICCVNSDAMPLCKGNTEHANDVFFTVETIKEKRKELTIAEIEKKLGYKIKIVGEG